MGRGGSKTNFEHQPRGLGFIGAHVFVGLVDFGIGEEVGGLRHFERRMEKKETMSRGGEGVKKLG
jgi:hypothetical protein